jgi:hypothetical protein
LEAALGLGGRGVVAFGGGGAAEEFGGRGAGGRGVVVLAPGLLVGWDAAEGFDGVVIGGFVVQGGAGEED